MSRITMHCAICKLQTTMIMPNMLIDVTMLRRRKAPKLKLEEPPWPKSWRETKDGDVICGRHGRKGTWPIGKRPK